MVTHSITILFVTYSCFWMFVQDFRDTLFWSSSKLKHCTIIKHPPQIYLAPAHTQDPVTWLQCMFFYHWKRRAQERHVRLSCLLHSEYTYIFARTHILAYLHYHPLIKTLDLYVGPFNMERTPLWKVHKPQRLSNNYLKTGTVFVLRPCAKTLPRAFEPPWE